MYKGFGKPATFFVRLRYGHFPKQFQDTQVKIHKLI